MHDVSMPACGLFRMLGMMRVAQERAHLVTASSVCCVAWMKPATCAANAGVSLMLSRRGDGVEDEVGPRHDRGTAAGIRAWSAADHGS